MTESDERLLTAAKLAEQVRGDLDGGDDLLHHAGLVEDAQDRSSLSFVESVADDFTGSSLWQTIYGKETTDAATRAVTEWNVNVMSHIVGVTEQDLDASALTLSLRLANELERHGALTTILAAGNPNTGKTNTMSVCAELSRQIWDDLLIISTGPSSWMNSVVPVPRTNFHPPNSVGMGRLAEIRTMVGTPSTISRSDMDGRRLYPPDVVLVISKDIH